MLMVDQVLSGLIAIIVDDSQKALIIDVRSYPGRTPQEPDTERITRGARDGYVENIIVNTALTRRRSAMSVFALKSCVSGSVPKRILPLDILKGSQTRIWSRLLKMNLSALKSMA